MSAKRALRAVLAIAVLGIAFSGVLTYRELWGGGGASCSLGAGGGCTSLLGLPVCVYGLIMYVAIATLSALGLRGERASKALRPDLA
ncbi:MAG TPA: vitamin K epoxide reductase family protein [Gemmatimonadaceae bacterium]|nr:vitamin K epoxide reductase family protein [Gemmatimonadaceae bacterium]